MGDRALVAFVSRKEEVLSPVVYLHWAGSDVPKLLDEHQRLMADRLGDVEYACARFIGICHANNPDSSTGMGVWNSPEYATEIESHGDAGVFIVNVDDYTIEQRDGYPPQWVSEEQRARVKQQETE